MKFLLLALAISAPIRLDVPVSFQLTRTRLLGPGATTLTESYRETWTLEVAPGGIQNLRSPRATVPAFYASSGSLMVSERDFSKLVGVQPADGEEPDSAPVSLAVGKTGKSAADINLSWSEEEHYAVHIEMGAPPAF